MPLPMETTHTGLTVSARKVDHEANPEEGAGLYEFFVELDGVPVVLGVKKAGTVDKRRAALKAKQAQQSQQSPAETTQAG